MPQSLTQLPRTTNFEIGGSDIIIQDHKCENEEGLFGNIVGIIDIQPFEMHALYEFEEHGICFEAAIEECVAELENQIDVLALAIYWHGFIDNIPKNDKAIRESKWVCIRNFSASVAGRALVDQLVEKIRDCDDWDELYCELHRTSKFHKEMSSKVQKWVK